jgi:TRAP-type transport system periplasmic protein
MRRLRLLTLAACLLGLPGPAQAQTVTIKLGTMAPDGSSWHNLLKGMGERWSTLSGGKVKLKIYAGGVAGNEGDMVRKLRVGQLNAAALSVVGLHDIETSAQCLAAPGLIADQAEQDALVEKMAPILNARFLEKGFQVLTWGDTGTVHIYLNKEVKGLADIKGVKMFAWSGDPHAVKSLELAGFQPVVISSTDIPSSMQTGMIQSFATADIMAFTARWFENAKSMVTATWGHLPGATIVNKDTWEKIPADLRPALLAASLEVGAKVNAEVVRMNQDALDQMKKAGLKMVDLPAAEMPAWYRMGEQMWPAVRGGVCTAPAFDEIVKVRDDYRASKGKK